jgi:hypothetical protein
MFIMCCTLLFLCTLCIFISAKLYTPFHFITKHITKDTHQSLVTHDASPPTSGHDNNVLILNIIGDSPQQLEEALVHALAYLHSFPALCKSNIRCRAFMPLLLASSTSSQLVEQISQLRAMVNSNIQTYPPTLTSRNIGSSSDATLEHVSEILFSLTTIEQEFRSSAGEPVALSLSFSSLSSPVFGQYIHFQNIFQRVSHASPSHLKKVLLLDKNKELTSPSDWHDLQVVVMALASLHTQKWLQLLQTVYFHHADRQAFTLREPRVAIMESVYAEENFPHVGFLEADDVCLHMARGQRKDHAHKHSLCPADASARTSSIPLSCQCPDSPPDSKKPKQRSCPCSSVQRPVDWASRLEASPTVLNERVMKKIPEFLKKIPESIKFGVARFRSTNESDMPQGFCWDTG